MSEVEVELRHSLKCQLAVNIELVREVRQMRDDYEDQAGEVERLHREVGRLHREVGVAEQNHRKTIAQVEQLRERLAKYGRHAPQCKGTTFEDGSTRPCDCGFE